MQHICFSSRARLVRVAWEHVEEGDVFLGRAEVDDSKKETFDLGPKVFGEVLQLGGGPPYRFQWLIHCMMDSYNAIHTTGKRPNCNPINGSLLLPLDKVNATRDWVTEEQALLRWPKNGKAGAYAGTADSALQGGETEAGGRRNTRVWPFPSIRVL